MRATMAPPPSPASPMSSTDALKPASVGSSGPKGPEQGFSSAALQQKLAGDPALPRYKPCAIFVSVSPASSCELQGLLAVELWHAGSYQIEWLITAEADAVRAELHTLSPQGELVLGVAVIRQLLVLGGSLTFRCRFVPAHGPAMHRHLM